MGVLAELPALPLHTAGKYVAGAYVVLFALVLVYVAIMAVRMSRLERELGELLAATERDEGAGAGAGAEAARSRSGREENARA
jgi:CcmD family protein